MLLFHILAIDICTPSYSPSVGPVLMDFSGFQTSGASVCTCRLFVQTGTRLYFNHLSSPGYVGCGTEIYISHRGTSIIRCLPAGEIVTVQPGDIVNVKITRDGYSTNVDSNYCYIVNTGMGFVLQMSETTMAMFFIYKRRHITSTGDPSYTSWMSHDSVRSAFALSLTYNIVCLTTPLITKKINKCTNSIDKQIHPFKINR